MTRHVPLWLCLLSAACTRQQVPPPPAEPPPATSEREVVLEAAAQKEAGVVVQTVEVRSVPRVLRTSGRVALNENRTWRFGAVTEGRIVHVLASAGDSVRQGQILARMHSHVIHESRAEYRKAVAELARAKSAVAHALRVRDRARRLFELKAGSLEQLEHAEAGVKDAQSAVDTAAIDVDRTQRHLLEFLQIPADAQDHPPQAPPEQDRDLIPIKSPAAGTLLARYVTPGTVVQPSGELFVVSDLSTLWAFATASLDYLARLRVGVPARLYVQAYPGRTFPGRVGKLGEEVDSTTAAFRVRIDVPNPAGRLKPEMQAIIEIDLGGSEPAIFIPREAPQPLGAETVVFVRQAPARFEVRPVRLGRSLAGSREVAEGLRPGEAVVTAGSLALKSMLLKASPGR